MSSHGVKPATSPFSNCISNDRLHPIPSSKINKKRQPAVQLALRARLLKITQEFICTEESPCKVARVEGFVSPIDTCGDDQTLLLQMESAEGIETMEIEGEVHNVILENSIDIALPARVENSFLQNSPSPETLSQMRLKLIDCFRDDNDMLDSQDIIHTTTDIITQKNHNHVIDFDIHSQDVDIPSSINSSCKPTVDNLLTSLKIDHNIMMEPDGTTPQLTIAAEDCSYPSIISIAQISNQKQMNETIPFIPIKSSSIRSLSPSTYRVKAFQDNISSKRESNCDSNETADIIIQQQQQQQQQLGEQYQCSLIGTVEAIVWKFFDKLT